MSGGQDLDFSSINDFRADKVENEIGKKRLKTPKINSLIIIAMKIRVISMSPYNYEV